MSSGAENSTHTEDDPSPPTSLQSAGQTHSNSQTEDSSPPTSLQSSSGQANSAHGNSAHGNSAQGVNPSIAALVEGPGFEPAGNLEETATASQVRRASTQSEGQSGAPNVASAGNPMLRMGEANVDAAAHSLASAAAFGNMLSYLANLQHLSMMHRVQQFGPSQPMEPTPPPPQPPPPPPPVQQVARASLASRQDAAAVDDSASSTGKSLSLDMDEQELSPYQCLVRKQIEIFEQPPEDAIEGQTTQGRNRPVRPGQVGIRCRHCGAGRPWLRSRGSILFPSTLLGVYQTAQNMANTHLVKTCRMIPDVTRQELLRIRSREKGKKTRKSAYGGGRQYWADSLRIMGVVETPDQRLAFENRSSAASPKPESGDAPPETGESAAEKDDDDGESNQV
jgi:hypothetical protein